MALFNFETNCVEAFDVSGHVDVFIDGAFYTRCDFSESFKVHLVLNPTTCKDARIVDDNKLYFTNDSTNTGDRHVGSKHFVSLSCQRQKDPSASKVTNLDFSSILKEIVTFNEPSTDASIIQAGLPDSNVVAKWDTIEDRQVSAALSLKESDCEDVSCDQEVAESVNDNGMSEDGLNRPHFHSHDTNKNVSGSSNTAVTSATSFPPSVEVSVPVSHVLKHESHDSGDELFEKDVVLPSADTTFALPPTVTVESPTSFTYCNNTFTDGKTGWDSQSMESLCLLSPKNENPSRSFPGDHAVAHRQSPISKERSQSKSQSVSDCNDDSAFVSSDNSDSDIDETHLNVQGSGKYAMGLTASGQPQKSKKGKCDTITSHLSCEFCGKTFVNTRAMNAHRLNPHCEVKCVTCNSIYSSKGSLFEHYCRAHPGAQDLKEQFGNEYSFVNLKLFMDQNVCPLCMTPLSDEDCVKHFDICHFTNQLFLCCVCGQDFSTEHLWKEHCHKEHGQQDTATHWGSESECENVSCDIEVVIESNDDGLSENGLCNQHFHSYNANSESSNTVVLSASSSPAPPVKVTVPVSPVLNHESHDSGDELFEKDVVLPSADTTFASPSTVTVEKSLTPVTCCNDNFTNGWAMSGQDSQSVDTNPCSIIVKDKNSSHLLSADNVTTERQMTILKKQSLSKFQCTKVYVDNALDTQSLLSSDNADSNRDKTQLNVQRRKKIYKKSTTLGECQTSQKGQSSTSQMRCEFCREIFLNERAKDAHRLNPHCEVKCVTCNSIYSSKGSLFEHYCRVHPNVQDVKEQFGNDYSFVNLKLFMDQNVCPLCMTPVSDEDCVKHFDISHFTNQLFLCCVCGQDFSTEHLWNEHCHKDHGQHDTATDGDITHGKKKKRKYMTRRGKQQNLKAVVKKAKPSLNKERIQHHFQYTSNESSDKMIQNLATCKDEQIQNSVESTGKDLSQRSDRKLQDSIKNKSSGSEDGSEGVVNHSRTHQCKYCKETFPSKLQLLSHPRRKITVRPECKQCGKECRDQADLIIHETEVHGPGLVYDPTTTFSTKSKGMVNCPLCLNKVWHLAPHMRINHTNESPFVCCVCGKGFQFLVYYTNHCNSLHTSKQKGRYRCLPCKLIFDNPSDFQRHRAIHDKTCIFCGEKFSPQSLLQQHYLEKHAERMIPCNHCDRKFPSLTKLKNHEKDMRFRPLQPCPKCGLMLRCMKKHMSNKHPDAATEAQLTQCNICGIKVKSKRMLKIHMRSHRSKFPCSMCSKQFKLSQNLAKHMRVVHLSGKMHECQICGRKLAMKRNLKVHMRIHSDTKLFPCTFCDQGFNYKTSLRKHMRSKHSGVEPTV